MILALMVSASTGEISPCTTAPSFWWLCCADDGSASNCCNASRELCSCASGGGINCAADATAGNGSCKKEDLEVLLPPPPRSTKLSMVVSLCTDQKTRGSRDDEAKTQETLACKDGKKEMNSSAGRYWGWEEMEKRGG
uniref:Uncharacterized protein n=1 Tax=Arundo donax TaxID=35708 RepID=A0A0A9EZR9_ARUDO